MCIQKTQKNKQTVCRKLRHEIGFSVREIAELLDISAATYQRYDNGTANAPKDIISAIKNYQKREQQRMKQRYRPGGELDREMACIRISGRAPSEVLQEIIQREYESGIIRL